MNSSVANDMLLNFRWHHDQSPLHKLTLGDLFDETVRNQHLNRLVNEFGSPSRAHAASMTAKRIGYVAALMIYARIKHNVLINPVKCTFITIPEESAKAGWLPVYSFPLSTGAPIESTIEWVAKELYAQLLVPLVELLAKEKGISRVVLYENLYTYMKWVFITKLQEGATFQELIEVPISDFGVVKQHPIATYANEQKSTRKTCCLYYQTDGAVKSCKSCPL